MPFGPFPVFLPFWTSVQSERQPSQATQYQADGGSSPAGSSHKEDSSKAPGSGPQHEDDIDYLSDAKALELPSVQSEGWLR